MGNKYKWDDISGPNLASYASLIKGAADSREGFFDGITKVGQDFTKKRDDTTMFNAEASSKSNTADLISQIRDGKTPVKGGIYDGMMVGDAKEKYKRDEIALGFRRRAEGRAISAANRARNASKVNSDNMKAMLGMLGGSGTKPTVVPEDQVTATDAKSMLSMANTPESPVTEIDKIIANSNVPGTLKNYDQIAEQDFSNPAAVAKDYVSKYGGEYATNPLDEYARKYEEATGSSAYRSETPREAGYTIPTYKSDDLLTDMISPYDTEAKGKSVFDSLPVEDKQS